VKDTWEKESTRTEFLQADGVSNLFFLKITVIYRIKMNAHQMDIRILTL